MFSKSHTFHLTIVILKGVARLIIFFAKTFVKDMMQCLQFGNLLQILEDRIDNCAHKESAPLHHEIYGYA